MRKSRELSDRERERGGASSDYCRHCYGWNARTFSGVLKRFRDLPVTPTWGSQSWLQPPFQAASLVVSKVSALQQQDPFRWSSAEPPRKAAAAMIGCPTSASQPNPENV